MNTLDALIHYEPRSLHHEVPIIWRNAHLYTVTDANNKDYIDFTSGIFVANVGHNRTKVRSAIKDCRLLHNYVFPSEIRAKLVEKLAEISGMEKVYLCSTGSEAVEAAIRCMQVYSGGRGNIEGLAHSFHGKTQGCRDIVKCFFPIHRDLGHFLPAGLIIEPYYGFNAEFHEKEWIQELCAHARKHNVPVCFDEVQAGFGRTGKMFGYEHYDVKPDLIVVGKGLGGGLPISAVLGRADLLDAPDDLSSTHTGNPVCCAAALANIEILEEEHLIERAAEVGKWLGDLTKLSFPEYNILGCGMVWALYIGDIELTNRIVDKCAEKGLLLVKTGRGTIKIGPPLITPKEVLAEGINILKEAIEECNSDIQE